MGKTIKFDFIDPGGGRTLVAKATAHRNGRIGFSSRANDLMGLADVVNRFYRVAVNRGCKDIYMVPAKEGGDGVYRIGKAGDYFYLNAKHVLELLGHDYKKALIFFDIKKREGGAGSKYFELKYREP